jgi:hypothetical protein
LVIPLFLGGSPAAVAWLVVAIIVDAINRVFWRRLAAHVSQETLISRQAGGAEPPSITYDYSPATISVIRIMPRI